MITPTATTFGALNLFYFIIYSRVGLVNNLWRQCMLVGSDNLLILYGGGILEHKNDDLTNTLSENSF